MAGQARTSRDTAASVHFVLSCALLALGACGDTQIRELSMAQCSDFGRRDEDGDGLPNCDDPDCWAHDFCRATRLSIDPTADAGGATISGKDAAAKPLDAGNLTHEDGGTPEPPEDAGPAVTCETVLCKPGEKCLDGACIPPPKLTKRWRFRIASGTVPDQFPAGTICYDVPTPLDVCSVSPAFICGTCKPDPYVIVYLNEAELSRTNSVENTQAPSWGEAESSAFEVELLPTDELFLQVYDYDPPGDSHELIFECEVEAATLTAGVIQCVPRLGTTAAPPFGTTYGITLEYVPLD